MGFTTFKKVKKETERFPTEAVLIQNSYSVDDKHSKTSFELSKTALEAINYVPNTPSINKITVGYDDNNELVLATVDSETSYTSNITSKNKFSNQIFMDRLVKRFEIDPEKEHIFSLNIVEEDGVFLLYLQPYGDYKDKLDYESMEEDGEDFKLLGNNPEESPYTAGRVENTMSFDDYVEEEKEANKVELF